ncbi:PRELI-like family-domain-containing protein [Pholiota molesta]|nr:PRELI-like family-domain-containing protein [Pholiota molesta]
MRFFSQSFVYDDSWSIVALAFFLRYPNPYASHVISCDVISRDQTPSGALPRWFPKGIVSRAESWVIEESEVDPFGKTVRCVTKNLDHVKVMQVEESVHFDQSAEGKTLQHTEARIVSRFGWGLTKKIENHGLTRFKANMQRSREGVSLILSLIRESRLQPMTMTMTLGAENSHPPSPACESKVDIRENTGSKTLWTKFKTWMYQPPPSE